MSKPEGRILPGQLRLVFREAYSLKAAQERVAIIGHNSLTVESLGVKRDPILTMADDESSYDGVSETIETFNSFLVETPAEEEIHWRDKLSSLDGVLRVNRNRYWSFTSCVCGRYDDGRKHGFFLLQGVVFPAEEEIFSVEDGYSNVMSFFLQNDYMTKEDEEFLLFLMREFGLPGTYDGAWMIDNEDDQVM